MKTVLMNSDWQFSRNMVVVREGGELTLINSVRLNNEGLTALENLGSIAHVVRIGSLHGRDDAFYKNQFGAKLWCLRGMASHLVDPDRILSANGDMPFRNCSLFEFRTTKAPEGIISLEREGGILIACDSLQNWLAPDVYFSDESQGLMKEMGFFQPANFGPVWMRTSEPQVEDFERLMGLSFRHVLCAHGEPLLNAAKENYLARAKQVFGNFKIR